MKPLSHFSHDNLELMHSMRGLNLLIFLQCPCCICHLLYQGHQQFIVLRVEFQLSESISKVLHFNESIIDILSYNLQRLKIMLRLLFSSPSLMRFHIHSELPGLQPVPIEHEFDLFIVIVKPLEEEHVDKVLQLSIQVSPLAINEFK